MHNIKELQFYKHGKLSGLWDCGDQPLSHIKSIIAVNRSIGREVKIIYKKEVENGKNDSKRREKDMARR